MSKKNLAGAVRMNSAEKRQTGEIPSSWRQSRPIEWRLRSLINQRRRARSR
jgi:hypothetical protein